MKSSVTAGAQPADPVSARLQGLPPLVSGRTRLLVLGSFPGVKSLQSQRYYAHPQNHFWKILRALWADTANPGSDLPMADDYDANVSWMLARGVGLWDVYAACEREGSLDSAIRHGQLNDLIGLKRLCPGLRAIAHNGAQSHQYAHHSAALGVPVYRLPSTSAANASWSFERKLAAWREVFNQHGLV